MEPVVAIAVSLEGHYDHFLPTLCFSPKRSYMWKNGASRAISGQMGGSISLIQCSSQVAIRVWAVSVKAKANVARILDHCGPIKAGNSARSHTSRETVVLNSNKYMACIRKKISEYLRISGWWQKGCWRLFQDSMRRDPLTRVRATAIIVLWWFKIWIYWMTIMISLVEMYEGK